MALKLDSINTTKKQLMKLVIPPFIIVFTILLNGCGGSKNTSFEKQNALEFKEATYSKWVAGIRGGGSGYNIKVVLDPSYAHIKLDSIYFKTFSASLIGNKAGLYQCYIDDGNNREVITPVYGETPKVKETPSQKNIQTQFELSGEEAVVSYIEDNTTKYYKFTLTLNTSIELPR